MIRPFHDLAEFILKRANGNATMWYASASHDGSDGSQVSLLYLRKAAEFIKEIEG